MSASRGLLAALVVAAMTLPARAQDAPKPEPPKGPEARPAPAKAQAPAEDVEEPGAWIGNRFLQTATPLVNDKGIFEANFNHRFYASIVDSGGSRLLGLDNGAAVYLSMDYAIVKNV